MLDDRFDCAQLELELGIDHGLRVGAFSAVGLLVTDDGDVLSPEGYDLQLSRTVRRILRRRSKAGRRKYRRWIQLFLAYVHREGEEPYAFLKETLGEGVQRVKGFYESLGLVVEKDGNHLSTAYMVSHPTAAMGYYATAISSVRELYHQLAGWLRPPASPADIDDWWQMSWQAREGIARSQYGSNKWAARYAGARFRAFGVEGSPPAMEDPLACGPAMTAAVIARGAPDAIVDIAMCMEDDGLRNSEPRTASALGWAKEGFDDTFWVRNKGEGDAGEGLPGHELAKVGTMRPIVQEHVVRRFEAVPHPDDPARTKLDWLGELWEAGDEASLRQLENTPLFPSPTTGRAYSYHGFYYWFADAIVEGNVLIRSDNRGLRHPTSQWYRHACISADMRELFASTENEEEREVGKARICEDYSHSSDQTERYAANEYERERVRKLRTSAMRRRDRAARRRAGTPAEVRRPILDYPGAQRALDGLPRRSLA